MTSSSYTRPVRRSFSQPVTDDQEPTVFHAPYLHEDCNQCEQVLLEAIQEGTWDEAALLPALGEAFFDETDLDPFNLYRHFHQQYQFNHSPFESLFVPVALPGKRPSSDLHIGDIVIMRHIISNRTYQAVITDPLLRTAESFGSQDARKPGAYVQVYGNFWGNQNSTGFIRVLDNADRTANNILILRKTGTGTSEEESISEAPAAQEYKLNYVKYGKGGGYMYGGDKSINYSQIFADNHLSDFETKTARHFIETEGGIDSINTYDNQVITWGFGFAGKSGNFTIALHLLLSSNPQARSSFQSYGITLTSEKKSDLSITTDGQTYTGDDALAFWKLSKPYLNILIQLTQQYAKDAFIAQWQTFKRIHATVFKAFADPSFLGNITDETEKNKAKAAVLHAHHHYPGFNPPGSFRNASSFEEVLAIYVQQSSKYGSVQGHANSWRKSINKIFSDYSAPLPVPPVPKPPDQPVPGLLRGSVGKGGQNHLDDVLKVQALLNGAGIPIPVTGQIVDNEGDVTILAIFRYQGKKKLKAYDGRIDPGGATIKALAAEAKLPLNIAGSESEAAEVMEDSESIIEGDSDPENALEFQWMNMKLTRHPRGHERLYYVTSGAKGSYGSCYFPFSIRNNTVRNFWDYNMFSGFLMNVYAQVQLTRTAGKKQVTWKQTTKDGEKASIWKKLILATNIAPGKKLVFGKGVEINQEMLQRARQFDNDDLSARMDIEIYFTGQQGFSTNENTKKKSLLFYLVRPIEYVFGRHFRVMPDKKKERALVISLRRRLLAVPAHLQTRVTVTISKTDTSSESQSFNVQASTEQTTSKGVTLSVPFSKLLDGLGLEATFSSEVKEAMAYSYTMEKSFSSEAAESFTTEIELPPVKSRFKYRQIFIEPRLVAVPIDKVYHYTDINEHGMAQKIDELEIPFIYRIDGWNINTDEFTNQ